MLKCEMAGEVLHARNHFALPNSSIVQTMIIFLNYCNVQYCVLLKVIKCCFSSKNVYSETEVW